MNINFIKMKFQTVKSFNNQFLVKNVQFTEIISITTLF